MNIPENWWQNFFSGWFVDCWLQATTEEQTRLEADFIEKMLKPAPHARLLDVPCGGGRHAVALSKRGYQMTGVDISPGFLNAARSKESTVDWEERDMRDLPWSERYGGAYSFGNSFGYLDDAGNKAFIEALARALQPGARFVLDASYITEVLTPSLQERTWYPFGDILFLADRHYDPVQSRLEVEYTCVRGGQTDKRSMSARIYSYREVRQLLEAAGFTEIEGYSSLTLEPFKLGSARLLMVGKKPQ